MFYGQAAKRVGKAKRDFYSDFDQAAIRKVYQSDFVSDAEKDRIYSAVADCGPWSCSSPTVGHIDATDTPSDFARKLIIKELRNRSDGNSAIDDFLRACGIPVTNEDLNAVLTRRKQGEKVTFKVT